MPVQYHMGKNLLLNDQDANYGSRACLATSSSRQTLSKVGRDKDGAIRTATGEHVQRVTSIRADVQKIRTPSVRWRFRVLNLLWFGRSVRTQILLVFIALNLVAASIAGGVIIFKAGASTRIEIAASMRLAELMANEAGRPGAPTAGAGLHRPAGLHVIERCVTDWMNRPILAT